MVLTEGVGEAMHLIEYTRSPRNGCASKRQRIYNEHWSKRKESGLYDMVYLTKDNLGIGRAERALVKMDHEKLERSNMIFNLKRAIRLRACNPFNIAFPYYMLPYLLLFILVILPI